MSSVYTIYGLIDSEWTLTQSHIFYIGVTRNDLRVRWRWHLGWALIGESALVSQHIRLMRRAKRRFRLRPLLRVKCSKSYAYSLEERVTDHFGCENLLNSRAGWRHTEAFRRRLRESWTDEMRQVKRLEQREVQNRPEVIAKRNATNSLPETHEKRSQGLKRSYSKMTPEERRARTLVANQRRVGSKHSEEAKKKISESNKARRALMSEEEKAEQGRKISESNRLSWQKRKQSGGTDHD
jgi:hypothetical protein